MPSVVHTPIIHARAPHTAILDAVAGFLIGAGGADHSYLMYVAAPASRLNRHRQCGNGGMPCLNGLTDPLD